MLLALARAEPVLTSPPTSDELRWDKLARDQQFVQLQQVRAVAERWRSGLTALTGLLAVVLTVAAPQAADHVERPWRLAAGLLQLIALAALALGAWHAMNAAFGLPERIRDNGTALRKWTAQATRAAVDNLKCARWSTVTGLAALALALAVLNAAPATPTGTLTKVVDAGGNAYCGALGTAEDGLSLTITGADGTSHTIKTIGLRSLMVADRC